MNLLRTTLLAALVFGAATVARADVIYLTSGGLVRGEITKETSRHVVVKGLGGTTVVPRQQIDRIVRGESLVEKYRKRLKKIDRKDPEARYALGLWLKSKKALRLARKEFKETIELDPNHRFAREELGYVRKDGQWILPGSEPAAAPRRAGRGRARTRSYSFKAPVSSELAQALAEIRSKKAEKRAKGWAILGDREQEVERILKVLGAERAPHKARLRSALIKQAPETEALLSAEPVDAEALRPHVERYVAKVVDPAVAESLGSYVRARQRDFARGVKRLEALVRDFDPKRPDGPAATKRNDALKAWAAARDEALRVIFDKTIYPDANHGRSGQPVVDEKVDKVKALWPKFDHLVQKDLSKFLTMSADEAGERLARLQQPLAALNEAKKVLAARNVTGISVAPPKVPALFEVLVRYQAGDVEGAHDRENELSPWGQQLLRRLQDERVRAYNAGMKKKNPQKYGIKPQSDEVDQVRITNDYRIMMGRPALEIDPRLVDSARGHSHDMTVRGYFDHMAPDPAMRTPFQRMAKAGYPAGGGENICMGYTSPQAAHDGWYNSSGHHRNILNATWRAMGSGRDGKHWTQNFGTFGVVKR